jgi:hypothetical protein
VVFGMSPVLIRDKVLLFPITAMSRSPDHPIS